MALPKRIAGVVRDETTEIAQNMTVAAAPGRGRGASFGGVMTGVASSVALVFSAISCITAY
jgi:hypothetical protein